MVDGICTFLTYVFDTFLDRSQRSFWGGSGIDFGWFLDGFWMDFRWMFDGFGMDF